MTPEEAKRAVAEGATVRLKDAHSGNEYARGRIISYSLVPTVTIELEPGGSRISWRHDLAEVVEPPKPDEPQGLGAVVSDGDAQMWVAGPGAPGGRRWEPESGGESRYYRDINVTVVHSHGVEVLADWERDLLRAEPAS